MIFLLCKLQTDFTMISENFSDILCVKWILQRLVLVTYGIPDFNPLSFSGHVSVN